MGPKSNGDMPAMPQDYKVYCEGIGDCPTEATGLTKREEFARTAMQGIIASDVNMNMTEADVAKFAVLQADALLAELAKEQDQ